MLAGSSSRTVVPSDVSTREVPSVAASAAAANGVPSPPWAWTTVQGPGVEGARRLGGALAEEKADQGRVPYRGIRAPSRGRQQ